VLAATALLAVNWLTYIWGVNAGYVVEASLGYFINPLVNVVLGVLFFREKLRRAQWLPVGLAILGVVYLTLSYGALPWIALVLAFTFAFYGLIKKTLHLGPFHSFTLEVGGMALPALVYLLYLELAGQGAFGHQGGATTALLALTGVVTALPLLWFATAARRIPFSTLGLLQYVTPTLQFLLGVLVYGEPFTAARMVGFALIWAALLLYSLEGVVVRRRNARMTPAR
jgi:chloramphenicol-sensitive protein RarD